VALARWRAARAYSSAAGQAEAMAILMRRTLMRTSAPIFRSLIIATGPLRLRLCICRRNHALQTEQATSTTKDRPEASQSAFLSGGRIDQAAVSARAETPALP